MVSFPPCKINIGLNVINKRSDGYHNLVTCFYPVPWTDVLEIIPSQTLTFTSSGLLIPGNESDNLCLKAYALLKKDFDVAPVKIHLHKIIPTGAGLGGGSSDAAYTLRMLNAIFNLRLPSEKLIQYASLLGSDCAFFTLDTPVFAQGRGEILSDISLSLAGKHIVIVTPDIHVSTVQAFATIAPRPVDIDLREVLSNQKIDTWKDWVKNDFETTVFKYYPELDEIKIKLYSAGALYASMSGSGSSVFGIFEKNPALQNQFSNYTLWSGRL
jgi:4-diphosphocytidyl-2-C-methyl-D-erythritol kinase